MNNRKIVGLQVMPSIKKERSYKRFLWFLQKEREKKRWSWRSGEAGSTRWVLVNYFDPRLTEEFHIGFHIWAGRPTKRFCFFAKSKRFLKRGEGGGFYLFPKLIGIKGSEYKIEREEVNRLI